MRVMHTALMWLMGVLVKLMFYDNNIGVPIQSVSARHWYISIIGRCVVCKPSLCTLVPGVRIGVLQFLLVLPVSNGNSAGVTFLCYEK